MDLDVIGKSESAEAVAFDLMLLIARVEDIDLIPSDRRSDRAPKTRKSADRAWLLNTYRECLAATIR